MRLAKSRPSLLLKAFSKKNTSLFGLLHLLVLCVALFSAGQGVAKPFVIGKVSDNPKKHYGYLKPMADYLANQLAEFGYSDGKVLLATNTQQLKQYMSAGQIDMVTETLFTAVELQDEVNAEPIVLKWKKGTPTYASIIFVRKDSEITSVEDLRGKIIAFEDRGSTSAFYIPIAELITAELELENIPSARAQRSTAKVSYVFTGEEINTSVLVHKKIVHAGAYSDENWKKEDHLPQALRGDLKIIHKSEQFPRAIEIVSQQMSVPVKNKLKHILINMHKDVSGQAVLDKYQKTTKFEELDETFIQKSSYARKVIELLNNELKQ